MMDANESFCRAVKDAVSEIVPSKGCCKMTDRMLCSASSYICLEPWHGMNAFDDETGRFEDKPHAI
ncbi:MAG: hypothetical protein IKN38_08595, partial [Clostridia bacterium]|nr:hypothetical protein [Clostridia bacterium]